MVARGPGPAWLRTVLVGLALCYFALLLKQRPFSGRIRAVTFFTEATCLFTHAATKVIDFYVEGWSCRARAWEPIDRRPHFPIEADNKESRFHRIAYFYPTNREVMTALDEWLVERASPELGGIRVVKEARPVPAVGDPLTRYVYDPFATIDPAHRTEMFWARESVRRARCRGVE